MERTGRLRQVDTERRARVADHPGQGIGAPGVYVPGFSLPKGVSPLVPIAIAGLITGNNDQREQAAYAIGDLVERTEESAIKPFVVPRSLQWVLSKGATTVSLDFSKLRVLSLIEECVCQNLMFDRWRR